MLNVVAQSVEATVFARPAFDARKERRTDLAYQCLRGVDGGQTLLDFLIGQAIAARENAKSVDCQLWPNADKLWPTISVLAADVAQLGVFLSRQLLSPFGSPLSCYFSILSERIAKRSN